MRGPGREFVVDIGPGGTQIELQLRRGIGQAAHTLATKLKSSDKELTVHKL